jgi:hypothetical protein
MHKDAKEAYQTHAMHESLLDSDVGKNMSIKDIWETTGRIWVWFY